MVFANNAVDLEQVLNSRAGLSGGAFRACPFALCVDRGVYAVVLQSSGMDSPMPCSDDLLRTCEYHPLPPSAEPSQCPNQMWTVVEVCTSTPTVVGNGRVMCSFIRALVMTGSRGLWRPSVANSRSRPALKKQEGVGRPSWKFPACSGEVSFIFAAFPHSVMAPIVLCLSNRNDGTPQHST